MSLAIRNDSFLTAINPATGKTVWEGEAASPAQVRLAIDRARSALPSWRSLPLENRIAVAERFAQQASDRHKTISASISRETGKPRWEADAEAKLVPAKVRLAIAALCERTGDQRIDLPQGGGRVIHRPVGVMAVLGPFNFPAHLPNGHLVPALLAGNAAVFKPSEFTPGTGEILAELWHDAGLPDGVLQVVQGTHQAGAALVDGPVDGVLFTGSDAAGCAIHRALAGRPEVLLALEMGGNNPLVIHEASNLDAAAYLAVVSAFISAGQRCTCARRLIVPESSSVDPLLKKIVGLAAALRVGMPDDHPPPFMGPVISDAAGRRVLDAQNHLVERGGCPLLAARDCRDRPAFVSPGVIDVTPIAEPDDAEVFGPLLQVIRVADFDAALEEADRTRYGLAASILTDHPALYERFRETVRAGVVNWNQPTTGASGRLPFGGLGASGNHRPSGYHAADYCTDATAAVETPTLALPAKPLPGLQR